MSKGKKFNFLKALGDYNLTNAETATLTAMWNHADADTGYLWANLAQINEWCSRAPKSGRTPEHIKKAEALGLLTIGGHGRSRNYTLNLNIKPVPKSSKSSTSKSSNTADKDLQDGGLTPPPRRTNTSTTTSTNTPTKEGSVKRNKLKEEVAKAKHYHSLDYKPSKVDVSYFPDVRTEAEARYNYLIRKGLKKDTPFQENLNWFVEWVRDEEGNLDLLTWLFLNFNEKVGDLTAYNYFTKKKLTLSLYQDYEERAGFVAGRECVEVVLPTIEKRLTRRGVEVVAL